METVALLWSAPAEGRAASRSALLTRWTTIGVLVVATRALAAAVEPYANALGPGTRGDDPGLLRATVDTLGGRLCFAPAEWPARASLLVFDHLPRVVGGVPAPLSDYGVLTGVFAGRRGLGMWVAALIALGLAAGTAGARRSGRPALGFPTYLVLVGAISTLVYGFATCSSIQVATLRYNLLAVYVPVGALLMALRAWPAPAARAGVGAAVVLWCALNALDVVALGREYLVDPPADRRQALATALQRRGVTSARAPYRAAYHLSFLSRERVRVSAYDFLRVREYEDEAARSGAPTIGETFCEGGEMIVPGAYLCR
jgi:hypothetical protein